MKKVTLSLVFLLFLSGCVFLPIPHDECDNPIISGTVINESKAPISNVEVEIKICSSDPIKLVTDASGKFKVPSNCERKIWYFIAMDPAFCETILKLSHPEYKEREISTTVTLGSKRPLEYGNIILGIH